jgi:hypothetical protein
MFSLSYISVYNVYIKKKCTGYNLREEFGLLAGAPLPKSTSVYF